LIIAESEEIKDLFKSLGQTPHSKALSLRQINVAYPDRNRIITEQQWIPATWTANQLIIGDCSSFTEQIICKVFEYNDLYNIQFD